MAKKLVSINLDEDLITAIDELGKSVGMSRSALVNLVMRGTVMGETGSTSSELMDAALKAAKAVKKRSVEAASV